MLLERVSILWKKGAVLAYYPGYQSALLSRTMAETAKT